MVRIFAGKVNFLYFHFFSKSSEEKKLLQVLKTGYSKKREGEKARKIFSRFFPARVFLVALFPLKFDKIRKKSERKKKKKILFCKLPKLK